MVRVSHCSHGCLKMCVKPKGVGRIEINVDLSLSLVGLRLKRTCRGYEHMCAYIYIYICWNERVMMCIHDY